MARGFPRINFEGGGVGGGDEPEVAGGARVSSRGLPPCWSSMVRPTGLLGLVDLERPVEMPGHVTEHLQVAGPTELR